MLDKLLSLLPGKRNRGVAMMAGGMLGLFTGAKLPSLLMFARGALQLEGEWRLDHPDFDGGMDERWRRAIEFYGETHRDPMNRRLHIIGIPMIVGGTLGLIIFAPFRPLWLVSAATCLSGWGLNFVGHGIYERNAPAFADDPLSFLAGPVWDFMQIFGKKKPNGASDDPNYSTVGEPARA